jgi:excisionase family DNA binding protein
MVHPMPSDPLPELMTVPEVAEVLRLSDETIHRWAREGRLEHIDINGVKRFHRTYIEGLVRVDADQAGK